MHKLIKSFLLVSVGIFTFPLVGLVNFVLFPRVNHLIKNKMNEIRSSLDQLNLMSHRGPETNYFCIAQLTIGAALFLSSSCLDHSGVFRSVQAQF